MKKPKTQLTISFNNIKNLLRKLRYKYVQIILGVSGLYVCHCIIILIDFFAILFVANFAGPSTSLRVTCCLLVFSVHLYSHGVNVVEHLTSRICTRVEYNVNCLVSK